MKLEVTQETFPLREVFTISRGSKTVAEAIVATVSENGFFGRGECVPYARYCETLASVTSQLEAMGPALDARLSPKELQSLMPPGAARNALDCALWDLEAKRAARPVHELAGLAPPQPVTTAYTLSLEAPEAMENAARKNAHRALLKIKLGGEEDLACIKAVRSGAPASDLIVDANEAWDEAIWLSLMPQLAELGVCLVEQPLPEGQDDVLAREPRLVPVCADESCHTADNLPALAGRYDFVNIKLDKTGGLTGALALYEKATQAGFGIMTGCMVASSLAMAPAMLIAHLSRYVDLDGPLLLEKDRENGLKFEGSTIYPPSPELWG